MHRLNRGVDKTVINGAGILLIKAFQKFRIHCQVVAANDDSGVLVKVLLLNPSDKIIDHRRRTGQNICILIIVLLLAMLTNIAVREVGIRCQHCHIEGLILGCQFREGLLGKLKEFHIFITPPLGIAFGKLACGDHGFCIADPVAAMLRNIMSAAAKSCIRSHQKHLLVALFLQHITNGYYAGHIGHIFSTKITGQQRHFHRQAGSLGHQCRCRPGCAVIIQRAAKTLAFGEVHIGICKLRKLRNIIVGNTVAIRILGIGVFHRLQENINKVSLLLGKFQHGLFRFHIILFNKIRGGRCGNQIGTHLQFHTEEQKRNHQQPCGNADIMFPEKGAYLTFRIFPITGKARRKFFHSAGNTHIHSKKRHCQQNAPGANMADCSAGIIRWRAIRRRFHLIQYLIQTNIIIVNQKPNRCKKYHAGQKQQKSGSDDSCPFPLIYLFLFDLSIHGYYLDFLF